MTPYEILTAAQELIRDPAKWCQRWYGIDAQGAHVWCPEVTDACSWCALGAVRKIGAFVDDFSEPARILQEAAAEMDGSEFVNYFNDAHDHADVMRLFDLARKKAKAAEAA